MLLAAPERNLSLNSASEFLKLVAQLICLVNQPMRFLGQVQIIAGQDNLHFRAQQNTQAAAILLNLIQCFAKASKFAFPSIPLPQ